MAMVIAMTIRMVQWYLFIWCMLCLGGLWIHVYVSSIEVLLVVMVGLIKGYDGTHGTVYVYRERWYELGHERTGYRAGYERIEGKRGGHIKGAGPVEYERVGCEKKAGGAKGGKDIMG